MPGVAADNEGPSSGRTGTLGGTGAGFAAGGLGSDRHKETDMYPNSALSAGQLALIAIVPVLCLAIWLVGVFVAARDPRRRESSAGTASLPQHQADVEEPQRKAA
jgi:hypothetical protein